MLPVLQIEEKVQQWQVSAASTLNPWFSMAPCWSELAVPALQFLAGESKCKFRQKIEFLSYLFMKLLPRG